jgi:3-hydroxyisobutyrate dehydrogenase-like beta-hydroxyacid dehydrogenase
VSRAGEHTGELRAGVIGLGMIGGGVAVSLARMGRVPTVYDIRAGAHENLDGIEAMVTCPREVAAESDVVFLAVVDAEQARAALSGDDGVLAASRAGLVVVLLSTVSPEQLRELSAICAERGVVLLDVGVTGGARAADNGLVVMVGGDAAEYERVLPVLHDFAKSVIYCGPLGAGMAAKLARNALTYTSWVAVREAASLAAAGGVPLDKFLTILEEGTDGGTDPLNSLRSILRETDPDPAQLSATLAIVHKDLRAIHSMAWRERIETPLLDLITPHLEQVFRGTSPTRLPDDAHDRGIEMARRAYGDAVSERFAGVTEPTPIQRDTVDHLFGEIWASPELTTRDKRLLVIGATTMLGRQDLLEVQVRGGIIGQEFSVEQLRQIVRFLHYYASWENGSSIQMAVERIVAESEATSRP